MRFTNSGLQASFLMIVGAGLAGGLAGAIASCSKTPTTSEDACFPESVFSLSNVDFGTVVLNETVERTVWLQNQGDLVMGIKDVSLGENDHSTFYSARYSQTEITCPTTETAKAVRSKSGSDRFTNDSATPPKDTSNPEDTGEIVTGSSLALDPGCRLPIHVAFTPTDLGLQYGSLILHTVTENVDAGKDPSYWEDPINQRRLVYLRGVGDREVANVVLTPRNYDYGHMWTGESSTAYFIIRNTGEAPLTLSEISLGLACDPGFEIIDPDNIQMILGADEATFVQVDYTAPDEMDARCTLQVSSDDQDTPDISVGLQANTSDDSTNNAPTVTIRRPSSGRQWISRDPLPIEINVFDMDQPATTLDCSLRSMYLLDGDPPSTGGDCTPTDDSGHVNLVLNPAEFGVGVDTIRVQVTDNQGARSYASITVLFNTAYPESDDDGDGWGEELMGDDDLYDCDDAHATVYPYAAEIADHLDNDCDGTVDEGTAFYDDDGDGFTEAAGDCNDNTADIYPGAEELSDNQDNDCDGTVDEGTSLSDDDGDGFSEIDNDCNDHDPNINPSAEEYCDGIDNDCNGLMDEADGCITINSEPYIVGSINMQQTACEEGEKVSMSLLVYDADGDYTDYAWTGDEGLLIDPLTGSSTVTVTCPNIPDDAATQKYQLEAVATDINGNPSFAYENLLVYQKGTLYVCFTPTTQAPEGSVAGGCAVAPRLSGLAVAGLALAMALSRRRRQLL
jgi:hypothetical protein